MKKKHYAQRQKERIQELENDIEKILNGDLETIAIHQIRLAIKWDTEKTIWQGETYYDHVVDIKVSTEESNKKLAKVLSEGKSKIIIR
jgi:hypothetical protein